MENYRKHLRDMSIIVLFFSLITCVINILDIFLKGFNMDNLPEGATEGLVLVAKIVMGVLSIVFLLPELYIGVKGIKIAKNPDSSKAHIVWAIILAVFAGFHMISCISGLTDGGNFVDGLINLLGAALDVAIYVLYVICAKKVRAAA